MSVLPIFEYRRGTCACSASGFLRKIRSRAESQSFHQRKYPVLALNWRLGKNGAYVSRCAVPLAGPKCEPFPGYAIIVRFTDGIGPLKATGFQRGRRGGLRCRMWQDAQAILSVGSRCSGRYCISSPSVSTASVSGVLKYWRLTLLYRGPVRRSSWGGMTRPIFRDDLYLLRTLGYLCIQIVPGDPRRVGL